MSIDAALNEVTKAYNTFKALEKVKDTLEAVKGFENLEKEYKGRIEDLKKEQETLVSKRDAILAKAQKSLDDSAGVVIEAQAQAVKILEDAKGKANALIDNAEQKLSYAKSVVSDAESREREIDTRIGEKSSELAKLEAKFNKLKSDAAAFAGV